MASIADEDGEKVPEVKGGGGQHGRLKGGVKNTVDGVKDVDCDLKVDRRYTGDDKRVI